MTSRGRSMHSLGRAAPGARDSADCAVSLEFLLQFARGVPDGYSTADVVRHIIRPVTAADRCRYAALLPPGALGRPQHYVCHRSAADFVKELVAVLAVSFAAAPPGSGLEPDAGYERAAGQYGLGGSFRSGLGRSPAQAAARRASKGGVAAWAAGAAGAAGAGSTAGNVPEAVQFHPGADAAGVRPCQPQQPHGGPTGPGLGPGQPQRTPSRGSCTGVGWGGGGGGPGGGAGSTACSSLLFPSGPLAGAGPGAAPEPLLMDAVLQPLQPGLQTHGHAHALQLQPAPPPAVMSRPGDSMRRHSSRLRAGRLGGGGGGESALRVSGGDVHVGGLGSGAGGAGGAGSLRAGSLRAGSTGHGSFTTSGSAAVGGGGVGGGGEDEAGMGGGSSRGRSCTGFVPAATSAAMSLPGAASGGDADVPGVWEGAAVQGGPRASLRASSATGHFEEAGSGALNPLMSRPAGPARSFGTPPPPAASSSCTSQLWGQLLQPSQPHMSLQPQPSGLSRSFGRASLTLGASAGSVGGGGNSSFTRPTGGALGAAGLPPRSPPLTPLPHGIAAAAAAGACVVAAAQVSASALRQRPSSCRSSGQGGAAGATGGGAGGGGGGVAATAGLARPKMSATGMAAVATAAGPGNSAGAASAANNSRPGTGSSGASSGHRQRNEELPDELDQQQQQQSQRISASSAAARTAAAIAAAATAGSGEAPFVAAHAHAPIPGASGAAAASGGAASALAAGRLVGPGTGLTNAQTVEQLQALFVGREHVLSQTRVWLDVFALDQHSAGDDTDQAGDLARLQEVLAASRSTVLVLDPAGLVLTRQWCLYELWATARRKGPAGLQVLVAAADCCGGSGLQGVWEELDVERAQAALEADRLRILADVRACAGGTAELNRVVKKAIVESSLHELSATRQAAPRGPAHGAAAQRAGLLLRTSGQAGEALTAAREAADVYAELLAEAEEEAAEAGAEEQGDARGPGGRSATGGDVHDWAAVAWGAGAALVQSLRLAALCHRDLGHTQQAAALLQEQVLPLLDAAPLLTTATCTTGTGAGATSSRHATARSAAAALTDLSDCLFEMRRYEHAAAVLGRSLAVQLSCLAAASAAAAAPPPGGAAALAAVLHRWQPADVSSTSGGGWAGGGSYSGQGAKDVAEAATKGLGAGTGTGPHGWGGGGGDGGLPTDCLPAALLALRSLAADAAAATKQQQQQHQCHLQQEEGEEDLEVGTQEGGDEQQQPDQRRSSQHLRHPSRQQSAASVRRASSSAAAAAAEPLAGGGGRGWRRTRGEAAAVAVDVAATLHKLAVVQMARAAQLGDAGEGAALRRLARDELDTALALFDAFGDGCTGLSRYSFTSVTSASSTTAAFSVLPPAADPVLWRRVLAARRSLVELLLEAGSPEAEGLLRSNLALAGRLHGPQHPATAAALSALAACLTRQRPGTAAAGCNSFGGGAKGSRAKPGGTHGSIHGGGGGGDTAAAAVAATARRLCEAEALYRRGLDVCRRRLGEAHVDTQVVATDLGVLLADLRKYSEAEPLLLGAVAVLPYSLPPGHARSLAAHRRLAEVLEARGKLLEAASMYQMTLQLAGTGAAGGGQQPHHPHQREGQQRGQQDEDEGGDAGGGGGGDIGGGGEVGVGACGGGREAVDHEMLLECRARLEAVNALLERAAAAEQGGTCCVVS